MDQRMAEDLIRAAITRPDIHLKRIAGLGWYTGTTFIGITAAVVLGACYGVQVSADGLDLTVKGTSIFIAANTPQEKVRIDKEIETARAGLQSRNLLPPRS